MTDEITLDAPETRIERFLAAAAGVEGITLDEPETRIERYLYKIAQGSGGVPPVEDADKGKYLHANESSGDLEWAEGGSGGGVLIVTSTAGTLDKTWTEIVTAMSTTGAVLAHYDDGSIDDLKTFQAASVDEKAGEYIVSTGSEIGTYIASSASGYPVKQSE